MPPGGESNGERPATPANIRKGATLGRYIIDDVLGHGAMATVFRARDAQLGRTVAIKVMNMAIAARNDAGERFRREAQAVAALKHPGIVEIHDFAAASDHEPSYIVAELIEGPTLRTFVDERRGRLMPELAVLIAAQVVDALAVAHEHGIVHRDVKPDNVMLEKGTKAARVVLTDFGVAHITGLETMTASGALVGSPAYMSPEQARGHDVGPAADLWGVGVMLYQMVTGTLPFPGKEPFTVIAAIARGTFRRASQVVAAVSPQLDEVIGRCLAADPAHRHASARALADELRALGREAGLGDELPALRRFLDDPDGFEAALRPRIADAAVERARQHVRRGELARALNQVSRANAYVSDHRGAAAVLRSISARRRWLKSAAIAGITALVGSGGYFGWALLTRPRSAAVATSTVAASTLPLATTRPPAPPMEAPIAPVLPTPAVVTPGVPPTTAAAAPRKRKNPRAATTSAPAPEQPQAVAEVAAPAVAAPVEQPPPAPVVPAIVTGTVELRASMALCHPSLDDRPISTTTTVTYADVDPGKHKVYCALDPAGPRAFVGEIDVKPGRKVPRVIKVTDGKPHF